MTRFIRSSHLVVERSCSRSEITPPAQNLRRHPVRRRLLAPPFPSGCSGPEAPHRLASCCARSSIKVRWPSDPDPPPLRFHDSNIWIHDSGNRQRHPILPACRERYAETPPCGALTPGSKECSKTCPSFTSMTLFSRELPREDAEYLRRLPSAWSRGPGPQTPPRWSAPHHNLVARSRPPRPAS